MSITFGFEPYSIDVVLARGSRFAAAIVAEQPWPDGVQIELRFTDARRPDEVVHRWPAAVTPGEAVWDVPSEQVDAVVDDHARHATLVWSETGSDPVLWGRGPARVLA